MRTDDPVILAQIRTLETTAAALRRICGFPPLLELPETTASRQPHWCPKCEGRGFSSFADLEHHRKEEHA